MKKNIGGLIKQARLQKGYTQEALAQMVGVQKSAVAKWENGRVSEIKRSNIGSLSEALGIDPVLLVGVPDVKDKENPSIEKEKPTVKDDGLSEEIQELIDHAKRLSPDDLQAILRIAKSMRPQGG